MLKRTGFFGYFKVQSVYREIKMCAEIKGKGVVMNCSESLFQKWMELCDEAERAILAYDAGEQQAGMRQMQQIWQRFQLLFAKKKDRSHLQGAYRETMSLMLNRMYWELEESVTEEKLWDFCRQVCEFFSADEIWREDQAVCLGRMFQKQGRSKECDQWFELCRKEEPENPTYMAEHAACKVLMGESAQALEILNAGLRRYPRCSYMSLQFYQKALTVYRDLGQREMAMMCQQKINELRKSVLAKEKETE